MSEYKDGHGDYYLAEGLRERTRRVEARLAEAERLLGEAWPEICALPDGLCITDLHKRIRVFRAGGPDDT